jgi:hypothetical protein
MEWLAAAALMRLFRASALGWSTISEQPGAEGGRRAGEEQLDALVNDPYARAWFSASTRISAD